MKKRIAIVGAGLCGSFLAALLRNDFDVTVIEQSKAKYPIYDDVLCEQGEINSSINRGAGLGGTTSYWHDALIELAESDLIRAGIHPSAMSPYYAKAWSLFLPKEIKLECDRISERNRAFIRGNENFDIGHMVVPYHRANAWGLANKQYPGEQITVIYGHADRLATNSESAESHLVIHGETGLSLVQADYFVFCAGGLGTPPLLARSLGHENAFYGGYHDHPMTYVAKIQLSPNSFLKRISSARTTVTDVRSGFVFQSNGIKTVFYLRPAINLGLRSVTGVSRYILSDLRNSPFSPTKIWRLLTNLDAIKEALLFKSKSGFHGDFYSVLMLGEQLARPSRGISLTKGKRPALNWHVMPEEHSAYENCFGQFLTTFADEIISANAIRAEHWEYRTAAHHSGASSALLGTSDELKLPFFSVNAMPNTFVCDASLLRASGISNTGLTLVGLTHRLAEHLQDLR